MLTEREAHEFAQSWLRAFNSHDLDEIMAHYSEDVVLVSPAAAHLLNDPSGHVHGKGALCSYFARGLEAYPHLSFVLLDVMRGLSSVLLYYKNQKGSTTGEFMELDADGKIFRVVANYSG
ncbi:nuclear transport factor 2 family protein [Fulvimonas sp. R45]|uniref:nuclear transport factor 2 family protein n=1 Tax=Fulvimonas sp. R45 TaxID=3045937 RepID=UPI00265E44F6|nr:nuclear transport factor 2 family protein [Fulvimonas sp. R45]MDO1529265.1 nuclear transport factor 2 family protein [Fulvimonas sp. R45]